MCKATTVAYVLLFVCLAVNFEDVYAGKIPYKRVEVLADRSSTIRVGMFAPDDAPAKTSPGKGRSFIDMKMNLLRSESEEEGRFFAVIMHSDVKQYLGKIGSDGKLHYCCNDALYTADLCPNRGGVIFDVPANETRVWSETVVFAPNVTTQDIQQFHNVSDSGIYYAYFINCKGASTGTVRMNGKITFMNPYGYLNGELYYYMPFWLSLMLTYMLLGFIWLFLSLKYRAYVHKLQNYIGGVILLGVVESAALYFDDLGYNNIGENYTAAMMVGVLFSTLKKTISRALVLVVCMGYGVVVPTLGTTSYKVTLLGIAYFIFSCALNVTELVQRSNYVPLSVLVFLVIPVAGLDTWFYWWIMASLLKIINQLSNRKQTVKLEMYQRFLKTLIAFGVVCVIVVFADTLVTLFVSEDEGWKTAWLWFAFWHLLYLAVLIAICVIWRPNPSNARYAYSEMDPEDEIEDRITLHTLSPSTTHRKTSGYTSTGEHSPKEEERKSTKSSASFTIDEDDEDGKMN